MLEICKNNEKYQKYMKRQPFCIFSASWYQASSRHAPLGSSRAHDCRDWRDETKSNMPEAEKIDILRS